MRTNMRNVFFILSALFLQLSVFAGTTYIDGVGAADSGGGSETISFRAQDSNTAASEEVTVTRPTGTTDGDILVAMVINDSTGEVTADTGTWTEISNVGTGMNMSIFYKEASSEPASHTFTTNGAADATAIVAAFSKTGGTWDLQDNANSNLASGNSLTTGSVTATDNSMLICAWSNDDNEAVSSPPSGMTLIANQNGGSVSVDGYYESRSSGAVTKSLTYSGGGEELRSIAIVLDLVP